MMNSESRGWDIFKLAVGLVPPVLAFLVSYSTYLHSPTLEKHLAIQEIGPFNFKDFVGLYANPDKLALSMRFNNRPVTNLFVIEGIFTNIGTLPIAKADYSENISVSVKPPWKLIGVENSGLLGSALPLHWMRVNDQRFEADPVLLNPGDRAYANAYATNTQPPPQEETFTKEKPQLDWQVRIVGVRQLERALDSLEEYQARHFGIEVDLAGWALPFVIATALLFQTLYLHLMVRIGLLQRWGWDWRTFAVVLVASLISFSAAECLATYIWISDATFWTGVNHWLNAPPIALHVVGLVVLWWMARSRSRHPSVPTQEASM